ncbi:hypothetical protein, partial [Nocardia anaemiae]|uniref:hypothetical protein n=1 Tax=Nocardia anaemiae TaxID=263910 RepID=UPI001C3F7B14
MTLLEVNVVLSMSFQSRTAGYQTLRTENIGPSFSGAMGHPRDLHRSAVLDLQRLRRCVFAVPFCLAFERPRLAPAAHALR